MGVLFDRAGTGLTPQGDPMALEELMLLIGQMGSGGGGAGSGLANMVRNFYIKKAIKNRSGARADKTRSGIAGAAGSAPGGGGMLGGMDASMDASKANLAAALPGLIQKAGGAGMLGGPGGAATAAPFPQAGAGTSSPSMPKGPSKPIPPSQISSVAGSEGKYIAQKVKDFYAPTPQKIKAMEDMMLSGDEKMRDIAQGWITAVSSGPKPKDYMFAVGGSIYNALTEEWSTPHKPPGMTNTHLPVGRNVIQIDDGMGGKEIILYDVPPGADWQLKATRHTYNDDTGEEQFILSRVDTETGLTEPVTKEDGSLVFVKGNVELTGEKVPKGTKTKWWIDYGAATQSFKQLTSLNEYSDDIIKALSLTGKIELAWGDVMSRLGIEPDEEWSNMKTGLAKAQHVANLYIKTITGAQMSEREADRLLKAIPSPRDNPYEWQAKLLAATELAEDTMRHYEFLLQKYGDWSPEMQAEAEEYSRLKVKEFEEQAKLEEGFGGGVHVRTATNE